mmetsp:Transcript_15237/g.34246  ORF Transcript_15237/g.34246 Transcript_15237/m.34246 type:complete len:202 (+) Transcript_15237:2796-3401(+)
MPATLCSPSLLTISITYSCPSRYSCTRIDELTMPSPLILPISKWKATSTSSLLRHRVTPSEPALSIGLTMALKGLGHSLRKASTTAHSEAKTCLTALSPALRTVSPMTYLFLRASESAVPLVRSPIASDSWSANSTPVSAPASTAVMGMFTLLIWSITDWNATSSSIPVSNMMVATKDTSRPSGTIFSRSFKSAESTQMIL